MELVRERDRFGKHLLSFLLADQFESGFVVMNQQHKFHKSSPALASYSGRHRDHPANAETVGDHAEARRPERFGKWHPHLPAVRERSELAVSVGFIRSR